ncbi:MAG: helix-turn-helix transcriptional regulator [Oscillospiraceae bacterium]|nr:helix-turn-helix transcriptional regulator [Oscillospiraceae bacterium]
MEKKTIGTFLTALRKANGLTQKQLAEKLNVSDKAVSRWERDECAPDLSLIPVLAEIYGVTSDEILRGQRSNPDSPVRAADTARAEKQRKQLLKSTQTRFHTRSLITGTIAIIGLIIACICNFELSEGNIGFLLSSCFYLIAFVSQIVFLMSAWTSIGDDGWDDDAVSDKRGSMLLLTEVIITGIVIIFSLTLPMLGASHCSRSILDILMDGIQYALIGSMICFITFLIINIKRSKILTAPSTRLKRLCTRILAILLILLSLGHNILNWYLTEEKYTYAPYDQIKTIHTFKRLMETKLDPQGDPMHLSRIVTDENETVYRFVVDFSEEELLLRGSEVNKYLIPENAPADPSENDLFTPEYGYPFQHLNRSVVHYELNDSKEMVPIRVYTIEHMEEAKDIALWITLLYTFSYILPIAITMIVYTIKKKKLSRA